MDQQKLAQHFAQMGLSSNGTPAAGILNQNQPAGAHGGFEAQGAVGGHPLPGPSSGGDATGINPLFSKVFPMLQGYMNDQSALACREVCRDWKAAVDVTLSTPGPNSSSSTGRPNQ